MQRGVPIRVNAAKALLWRPHTHRPCRVGMLFICGNPGLCEFYDAFLTHVHERIGGQGAILCTSALGHDTLDKGAPVPTGPAAYLAPPYYSLHDQIAAQAHAFDVLTSHVHADTPCFVGGHSIGAYIALLLFSRDARIRGVQLLFPTLSYIADTPKGRRTAPLVQPPRFWLVRFVIWCIASLLPQFVCIALITACTGMSHANAAVTQQLFHAPQHAYNALCMGRDEMDAVREIPAPVVDAVRTAPDRTVRTYWAAGDADHWAPSWSRHHAEATLGLTSVSADAVAASMPSHTSTVCAHGAPHSFCLDFSQQVAGVCAAWLAADWGARGGAGLGA
ncbi:hypothetical protein MSPP1_000457 [Malassezia sp. CBS 17886]|nr:hypothetical protein MSPP1_000457 [Malassezia sp. CBS 17886]